jgi:hypothetical protein
MNSNIKKTIVFTAIVSLLLLAGFIYYYYQLGPRNVENAKGEKIAAADLYQRFSKDILSSKIAYLEKILEVGGTVSQVLQNQQNEAVVLLKTNQSTAAINCTLEGPVKNIKEGDQVTIKGICSGMGETDNELGINGDVYLIRCFIIQ